MNEPFVRSRLESDDNNEVFGTISDQDILFINNQRVTVVKNWQYKVFQAFLAQPLGFTKRVSVPKGFFCRQALFSGWSTIVNTPPHHHHLVANTIFCNMQEHHGQHPTRLLTTMAWR